MANPNNPTSFLKEGRARCSPPNTFLSLFQRHAFRLFSRVFSREGGCAARSRSLSSIKYLLFSPLVKLFLAPVEGRKRPSDLIPPAHPPPAAKW